MKLDEFISHIVGFEGYEALTGTMESEQILSMILHICNHAHHNAISYNKNITTIERNVIRDENSITEYSWHIVKPKKIWPHMNISEGKFILQDQLKHILHYHMVFHTITTKLLDTEPRYYITLRTEFDSPSHQQAFSIIFDSQESLTEFHSLCNKILYEGFESCSKAS
jgi:hypothetical protein